MGFSPLQFLALLKLKLSSLWQVGVCSHWLLVPLNTTLEGFDSLKVIGYVKIFQACLVYFQL